MDSKNLAEWFVNDTKHSIDILYFTFSQLLYPIIKHQFTHIIYSVMKVQTLRDLHNAAQYEMTFN